MAIRELLEKNKMLGVGVGGVMIVVASVAIMAQGRSSQPVGHSEKAFFSDDDGQTWFADSFYKFAPFDHNGKVASRAFVYTAGGKQFVGFLQRYHPDTKKAVESTYDAVQNGKTPQVVLDSLMGSADMFRGGMDDKLPGGNHKWMVAGAFSQGMVKSPNGQPIELVVP